MAFDDGTQTGVTRSLGVSSGEFQAVRPTYEAVPALVATPDGPITGSSPVPNLHYVFDDPNDGEPGRDRMLVHGLWELALALAIAAVGFAVAQGEPGALGGDKLRGLLLVVSLVALLGIGSGLALRAGVPNLAIGGAAVVAGVWVVQHADGPWFGPAGAAIGICAAIGLVQGLVVVGLHVPSWAASLAVLLGAGTWAIWQEPTRANLDYDPRPDAYLWFATISAVSVVLSLFGLAPGIRRGVARFRPIADPARRRGVTAAVLAVVATTVSMALGGLAGAFLVLLDGGPDRIEQQGLALTAVGLGAALLGGTSAFGRRGGIFGTIFASCLMVLVFGWFHNERTTPGWVFGVVGAAAIGIGLVATRLVERFGRPVLLPPTDEDESWMPRVHGLAPSSRPWQPAPTPTGGLWSDEGWGDPPR